MADEVCPPNLHDRHPRRGVRRLPLATLSAALGVVALGAAACGSSSSPPASSAAAASTATTSGPGASAPTVKVTTTSLGKILETNSGMALYTYGPNHGSAQNTCTGACLQAWPALTVAAGTQPVAGPGLTGTLGTAKQSDGALWVTYDGNLLYTFLSDQPGQVTGNGVAGFSVARLAATASAAPTATTTTPRTTTTTQQSGGGGYNY